MWFPGIAGGEHRTQLVLQPFGWPSSQVSSQTGLVPSPGPKKKKVFRKPLCFHIPTNASPTPQPCLHHKLSLSFCYKPCSCCTEKLSLETLLFPRQNIRVSPFSSHFSLPRIIKHFRLSFCRDQGTTSPTTPTIKLSIQRNSPPTLPFPSPGSRVVGLL